MYYDCLGQHNEDTKPQISSVMDVTRPVHAFLNQKIIGMWIWFVSFFFLPGICLALLHSLLIFRAVYWQHLLVWAIHQALLSYFSPFFLSCAFPIHTDIFTETVFIGFYLYLSVYWQFHHAEFIDNLVWFSSCKKQF